MKHTFKFNGSDYTWDDQKPIDISIPISNNPLDQPNCFYAPFFKARPVVSGDFVGSTDLGGIVNFFDFQINPHGNGTHTECVGHISNNGHTINQALTTFHAIANLVTVYPTKLENGDLCITRNTLEVILEDSQPEALILRLLPNGEEKMSLKYSGTNPAYISKDAMDLIVELGVRHLLIDQPSVDKEEDGGALAAHKSFWMLNSEIRLDATITELIYVANNVKDGLYLLNLQIASFEMDVSPSKPVLYVIEKKK